MHLFLLRYKKICLSVLLTNQSLDNGLTVRTPFQILVNYIYNKIIKQNGFKPKPMRSSFLLATATHVSSRCCSHKPKLQSARTCTPSCLWTPNELLTKIYCTLRQRQHRKGEDNDDCSTQTERDRRESQGHLPRNQGTEDEASLRTQAWLSGWLAGLPTAQVCSAVEPWVRVLRDARARLKGGTTLGEGGQRGSGLLP